MSSGNDVMEEKTCIMVPIICPLLFKVDCLFPLPFLSSPPFTCHPPFIHSRIHGDIERDYNNFQIDPTYYSQGPGNFRDIAQNRRDDVSSLPQVGTFNINMFLSFVQADGYNPLTVGSTNFKVPKEALTPLIAALQIDSRKELDMVSLLSTSFRIGNLFQSMQQRQIVSTIPREEFVKNVIGAAEQSFAAQYAQNGYYDFNI